MGWVVRVGVGWIVRWHPNKSEETTGVELVHEENICVWFGSQSDHGRGSP